MFVSLFNYIKHLFKKISQGKSMKNLLVASPEVIIFHSKIQDFCIAVNREISEIDKNKRTYPTAGDALLRMSVDMLALHRSIYSLCSNGWSQVCPIILRTMLELHLSVLIITRNTEDCEYFGFKYLYRIHKEILISSKSSEEGKKESRRKIDEGLVKLSPPTQGRAKEFIFLQKMGGYWYCPEYSNPKNILESINNPSAKDLYDTLSSATHGGVLGLSIFKGQPDDIHPDPRADTFSQNAALSYSSRILLESSYARGIFEGCNLQVRFEDLFNEYLSLKKFSKEAISRHP